MVNRAGNSCSPVRGSFFGAAIPAVCRYGILVAAAVEMVVSKNTWICVYVLGLPHDCQDRAPLSRLRLSKSKTGIHYHTTSHVQLSTAGQLARIGASA